MLSCSFTIPVLLFSHPKSAVSQFLTLLVAVIQVIVVVSFQPDC